MLDYWRRPRRRRYCLYLDHYNKIYTHIYLFSVSVLFGPLQLLLTNQLEMEKMKVEQEKKKCYLAQEALKEKVLHGDLL